MQLQHEHVTTQSKQQHPGQRKKNTVKVMPTKTDAQSICKKAVKACS